MKSLPMFNENKTITANDSIKFIRCWGLWPPTLPNGEISEFSNLITRTNLITNNLTYSTTK